jgi:formamidopyrimidine-DNA glycosylase
VPELPDVDVYVERIADRFRGHAVSAVRLASPFVLRTVDPPIAAAAGKKLRATRRVGKRVVLGLEDDLFLVIHLMVAGRFRLGDRGAKIPGKVGLLAIDFDDGALILTEASPKKRASLHVVRGEKALAELDPKGLEVLDATTAQFAERLRLENRTLKRALTDPRLFSGIGNAYSDEILHGAKLSPVTRTQSMADADVTRLFKATVAVLTDFRDRIRAESPVFPEKVTAFREDFAVHGKFGKPCPRCKTPVQRIRYADNESNYCPTCQTGGKLLADRSLSRLLRGDWPKTLEELEARKTERTTASGR